MTLAIFFILLIIYSFLGWVLEVVYTLITRKRLVNRGFLYGPLCPIYGAGCMLIAVALAPLGNNVVLIFIAASVLTTSLEYATSWAMEKMFSTTWWDYSKEPFNLNGRICLVNSLAFGFMGVFIVWLVHPFFVSQLSRIPSGILNSAAVSLFIISLTDFILTLKVLINLDKKIGELKTFISAHILKTEDSEWFDANDLRRSYARLRTMSIADAVDAYADRLTHLEKILARSAGMRRLFRSFPGMQSKKHDFSLNAFKPGKPSKSVSKK